MQSCTFKYAQSDISVSVKQSLITVTPTSPREAFKFNKCIVLTPPRADSTRSRSAASWSLPRMRAELTRVFLCTMRRWWLDECKCCVLFPKDRDLCAFTMRSCSALALFTLAVLTGKKIWKEMSMNSLFIFRIVFFVKFTKIYFNEIYYNRIPAVNIKQQF